MKPYQLKLDFGEGQGCHKAYEEYLEWGEFEDEPERWAVFVQCWKALQVINAIEESQGATKQ